jgi:N-acetylmuramoyl-L-alanine amidase
MIVTTAAALLCQLVGVTPVATNGPVPAVLSVKANGAEAEIPIVQNGDEYAVRADLLTNALGGSTHSVAGTPRHYLVAFTGIALDIDDHNPFARLGDKIVPLGGEPYVVNGQLYLPYSLVTDVGPRIATGLLFDADRGELRVFSALPPSVRSAKSGDVLVTDSTDIAESAVPGRQHLVVVDAGHGGPDHGMSGPIGSTHPIFEKDITLAVAQKVAVALRERGMQVVMTRTRDTLIALSDRGKIANEHHGDLFLSIHVNAANLAWHDPAGARGFETYFLAAAKTEDAKRVADMENEAVRFENGGADASGHDPLNFIMSDMAQNEHLRESSELAAIIQKRLGKIHPGPSRGVKQAGFRVLVTAYMPAVLVEIGFGTNADEAKFLANPGDQRLIAGAIAAATAEYLARYERRTAGGRTAMTEDALQPNGAINPSGGVATPSAATSSSGSTPR